MMMKSTITPDPEKAALKAVENTLMSDPEYLQAVKDARGDGSCIGYGRYAGRCKNPISDHNLYCPRCNAARWAADKKQAKEAAAGRPHILNMPTVCPDALRQADE